MTRTLDENKKFQEIWNSYDIEKLSRAIEEYGYTIWNCTDAISELVCELSEVVNDLKKSNDDTLSEQTKLESIRNYLAIINTSLNPLTNNMQYISNAILKKNNLTVD